MKIHFEDQLQDFLWWELDTEGNIIDCGPFQASIWVGGRVPMPEYLEIGDYVDFIDKWGNERTLNYIIVNITDEEVAP